ncbi:hypothetical protein [Helicobacter pylori]|uniref:hypothetical protein n=1 Tax=Helicobacter pylori TaxID=210 RepID=UPI0004111D20|nr:hypothetical protein [Helicobacter pylori]
MLNYDFLEMVDEPRKTLSLTEAIDKAMENKRLIKANKPRVKIKDGLSLRDTLDAFGDELSRLKNQQPAETIKGSTIESANLNSIVNKIKSGLPFGTISAFRPFRPAFEEEFTEEERKALIYAYKSGFDPKDADIIAKYWLDHLVGGYAFNPIKVKDFFNPQPEKGKKATDKKFKDYKEMIDKIYLTLCRALGRSFVDKFIDGEAKMRDFMSNEKFIKKYRYTQKDNMQRTRELKSLLDQKRDFIGYIQVLGYWKDNPQDSILPDKETSFFVFTNEPSNTFDLKNHLLLWGEQFNQQAICYGSQVMVNKNKTYRIDLISTEPNTFGKVWTSFTGIKFSTPSDLPQALTRIQDSVYTFLSRSKGISIAKIVKTKLKVVYMPIDYSTLGIRTIAEYIRSNIKAQQQLTRAYGHPKVFTMEAMKEKELQAIKYIEGQKCAVSDDYRQSYNHNIKVNNLVKAMKQGRKVGKRLKSSITDTDAGYCFISPTDLATQLDNISPRLSKSIITAIDQAEGVRLTYALIDKITYNSLHNILNFIFDIDNPLSDQSFNQLVIEVPREALKNVKLPQVKNVLTAQIFDGAYHFRGDDFKFKG